MITVVIKRDERIVPFDENRLVNAIYKAALSVDKDKPVDKKRCVLIANKVKDVLDSGAISGIIPTVESIQDIVEETLVNFGHYRTAKAYILYRAERTRIREAKSALMSAVKEIVFTDSKDSDLMRENANISSDSSSGAMYKIGSETSKVFAKRYMMSKEIAKAHESGLIHIHDLDYYKGINCLQIPAKKLLNSGFVTGYGFLRTPNSIGAYATLMCIIIQSSQNDCYGGQSIPEFEYALSFGVMKSYIQEICIYLECHDYNKDKLKEFKQDYVSKINNEEYVTLLDKYGKKDITSSLKELFPTIEEDIDLESMFKVAYDHVNRDTYQAMEALIHNLNTLASRAGNQVPFSSINFGTGTTEEERMISYNFLCATDAGLGDGETPIFPISIFRVKEGINYNPGDPNYDLFKLSCKVSAKRLFPNYLFLDSPFNLQYYKEEDPNTYVAVMGCRTRVMGNNVDPSYEKTSGRGNISMTTMNLPMLALEAHGDIGDFYKKLDETIALVKDELLDRFNYQSNNKCLNFPFMMGQGLYHDSDHMDPEETVKEQIKHGTLTFGFIGLAEALIVLLGEHHGESEYAQNVGLDIIKHIREKANEYSKEYKLNFSLIGSPAEGTTGRFAKILKSKYGVIPRVTDKDYLTNSSHIPVDFPISIRKKIEIEAPYHEYCNGGRRVLLGHLTLVNAATSKRCV